MSAPDSPTQEIHCPLCEYDLRGLPEPRCPECGYAFDWRELTDPARRKHPYLFEHHPEKNVQSFLRTVIGHLLPRRYWRKLRPETPSNRRRLIVYWCVLVGLVLAFFVVPLVFGIADMAINNVSTRSRARNWAERRATRSELADLIRDYGSIERYIDTWPTLSSAQFWRDARLSTYYNLRTHLSGYRGVGAVMFLSWPWLTLLAMRTVQVSMRRARIMPLHIVRTLVYASDTVVWFMTAYVAAELFGTLRYLLRGPYFGKPWNDPRTLIGAAAFCAAVTIYRLWIAFKLYLRFPHALAVVAMSQLIVGLAVIAVVFYTPGLLKYMCECLYGMRYYNW